jgi:hypothetical protein
MAGKRTGKPAGKPATRAAGHRTGQHARQLPAQSSAQLPSPPKDTLSLFTIGHSTRPIEEFIELLRSNGVRLLIDIRTIPKSRRNPQFAADALAKSLHDAGIDYLHLKALGGLRHARPDSPNLGWRNASFRGYADYMQTPEFAAAIERAIKLATGKKTALMCAEAVPWRCHRSLVADALTVRGIEVKEIIGASPPKEHKLTPFASVHGSRILYPKDPADKQLSFDAERVTPDAVNANSKSSHKSSVGGRSFSSDI